LRLWSNESQPLQHNVLNVSTTSTFSFEVDARVEAWGRVIDRAEDAVLDCDVANATRLLATNRNMLACERAVAEEHILRRFVKHAPGKVNTTRDSNRLQTQAEEE
jgi:hypothetical protein